MQAVPDQGQIAYRTTLLAPHSQARVAAPQRVPSFFERDLSAIEETPKRADADRNSKLL
jgi:hypothetical protein